MNVFHPRNLPSERATHPMFVGTVYIQRLTEGLSQQIQASVVSFKDGARNTFHTHDNDQILVVTEGEGIIATEGGEWPMSAGDVVFIPAGESHWHGAQPGHSMTHVSLFGAAR